MPTYSYRLTLTPIDPASGDSSGDAVTAELESHDDIAEIIAKLRRRPDLDGNEAAVLGLGLKSLGWVLLRHKKSPFYAGLLGQLGTFIKSLKTAG
ncbi:DUF3861 domain-containing protein [Leisingera sp. JC1]|uniref:DUF3861 domain-containing protein n=1 Tax=Leisingera sp. JC1 TaxID=1855282 RepID=UPI000802F5AF|nr:DUF3861 domain-containing protein [Leisingera sp. JC1]OBY26564.1 hypothetical protein A9D60_18580 [Leisingera sp. JC1]